jgi:uncharacterized FlaG/YvyC family protein
VSISTEAPSDDLPDAPNGTTLEADPETTDPETTTPDTTTPGTTTPHTDDVPAASSADELKSLSDALIAARTALQEQDFEAADEKLSEAETFAKSDEHKAMVARLKKAQEYLSEFRAAIDRAMKTLDAGVSFQVSADVIVAVVERKTNAIIVKVAGRNQSYPLNQLPLKLGVALADQGLQESEDAPLIKGVFQALHARATEKHINEVRVWWEKAGEKGAELLPLLDDDYEAIASPGEESDSNSL